LNVLKCKFGDVDEAVFNNDEEPFERTFWAFKKAI
jgi:hypothetical protein